ncbi:hypothetical protein FJTKL_05461 [Diaporthe vaccinii]|uniref:Secreted protein n=1 Tax=Diaporthe vaccinii TaxID=105482 RepID=A0ABR4FFX9_9PEZI
MTWPGTAPSSGQSVLAVLALCGPVWFRESILALWRGPTKDREIGRNENAWPPDCSRSRRRSEEVHDAQVLACDAARLGQMSLVYQRPAARRTGWFPRAYGAWHRRAKNRRWGGHGNWQESV